MLRNKGWKVLVIWECDLESKKTDKKLNSLLKKIKL